MVIDTVRVLRNCAVPVRLSSQSAERKDGNRKSKLFHGWWKKPPKMAMAREKSAANITHQSSTGPMKMCM